MIRLPMLCLGALLAAATAFGADDSDRLVRRAVFPGTTTIVVVAEGEFEPRSLGSYTIRAYAMTNPRTPYDDFIAGSVRPRDGTVSDIRFADLDRDGLPEVIVIIRSAGSGSYLSADAFQLKGKILTLMGSVSGLAGDADPVHALEAKLGNRVERGAAPYAR
jgi:hypothetical protein